MTQGIQNRILSVVTVAVLLVPVLGHAQSANEFQGVTSDGSPKSQEQANEFEGVNPDGSSANQTQHPANEFKGVDSSGAPFNPSSYSGNYENFGGGFCTERPENFRELVNLLLCIIMLLIPFVFAFALIVVIWGITKAWILNAGDEEAIVSGRRLVIVGVIALVIMSSIWGIVAILSTGLFG